MMRYSATGPHRTLDKRELLHVFAVVASLDDVTEFTTGAAYGVDTAAFIAAADCYPEAYHRLCIPAAPHNTKLAKRRVRNLIIEDSAIGFSTFATAYMERNDRLIQNADVLLAFPETDVEQLRSGTWATIRRARRAGLEVRCYPLEHAGEAVLA